jgi:hypothetical protein
MGDKVKNSLSHVPFDYGSELSKQLLDSLHFSKVVSEDFDDCLQMLSEEVIVGTGHFELTLHLFLSED